MEGGRNCLAKLLTKKVNNFQMLASHPPLFTTKGFERLAIKSIVSRSAEIVVGLNGQ